MHHHPPLLRPSPPFPAAPISIPTPVPPGLRPSPLFVLRALYKCRMLVGLRRCKPFIFTDPRNEFFCAACHEEDGLVHADLGSHEACVHQDELILGPRASPRPYCMYQALVAWLYQAHNARIIMPHHMAQYMFAVHYMQICALTVLSRVAEVAREHGSTGGTRRKVWTRTKILSLNIRYFVAN